MSKKLGATGNFPAGKISDDDEGELSMGVTHDQANGTVIIHFGKLISWVGLYPSQAEEMAQAILKHAEILRKGSQ